MPMPPPPTRQCNPATSSPFTCPATSRAPQCPSHTPRAHEAPRPSGCCSPRAPRAPGARRPSGCCDGTVASRGSNISDKKPMSPNLNHSNQSLSRVSWGITVKSEEDPDPTNVSCSWQHPCLAAAASSSPSSLTQPPDADAPTLTSEAATAASEVLNSAADLVSISSHTLSFPLPFLSSSSLLHLQQLQPWQPI